MINSSASAQSLTATKASTIPARTLRIVFHAISIRTTDGFGVISMQRLSPRTAWFATRRCQALAGREAPGVPQMAGAPRLGGGPRARRSKPRRQFGFASAGYREQIR